MTEDLRRIERFIAALTRRERALLLARIALHGCIVASLVALLAIAAASLRWDRAAAVSAVVLVGGVGTWIAVVAPLITNWRRTGDSLRQARLTETLTPALRGRLLTAVERTGGPQGQESPELLALIARRTVASIGAVSPGVVHPARRLLRVAGATTLLGFACALVAFTAPGGPLGTLRWWAVGASAKAAMEGLQIGAEEAKARVGDLVLEYTYPDYTGLDPVTVNNSTGDAHGPPGTRVRVVARSADPVEAAALVAYDQPALDAQVEEGRVLSGSFTIQADPGAYHLVIYRGGEPESSRDFTITPEPDLAPDVNLDLEEEILEVAVDQPLAIPWRARDDYGISRVTLRVDGRDQEGHLAAPLDRKAEVFGLLDLRPVQLGLMPGQEAVLQVAAWDNDTFSGSKPGLSRSVRLVVLGPRGLDRMDEARQEALRDLMLVGLADHLEEQWPAANTQDGIARWGQDLVDRYTPLNEAVEDLWSGIGADTMEARVVQRVQRAAGELIRYTQVAFVPGDMSRPGGDELAVTADLRDKCVVALEDGVLALDRLITLRALRNLGEDAQQLQVAAENLKEMMQGEPEVEEMLSRLDALERQLLEVAKSAARLNEGGLKEFVNQRQGEMQSLLDEIREAIAEGRMDEARELMEQLARQVEQMSQGVQDNLERMKGEESDAMAQAQDLEQRLEELEQRQLALQEELRTLREQSDSRSAEAAEALWKAIEKKAGELAKQGNDYTQGLEKAGRSFNEEEVSRKAEEQLEHLEESATARDLNGIKQALPQARRDWSRVESRRQLMEATSGGDLPGPGNRETSDIQGGLRELEEMVRKLEEMSSSVQPELAEQVRRQGEQQSQLEEDLQQARRQAEELAREFPVRPEGMKESLQGAQEQMGQASDDIGRGRPMQAEGAQEMAAQGIRDARDALRQAMEQSQQQAQQLQQQGQPRKPEDGEGQEKPQPDRSARVELPSPEEFRTPEEYRRALLEGMQGDVPEEYRALKKRYYEELVHQ